MVPQFVLDYQYYYKFGDSGESELGLVLAKKGDTSYLERIKQQLWESLKKDHLTQEDRTLEMVNAYDVLLYAIESIPWNESQQMDFDELYNSWAPFLSEDPHSTPSEHYSTILALHKWETTKQPPDSHFSEFWKVATTTKEPVSKCLWRFLNEWRIAYMKEHHPIAVQCGNPFVLPILPIPWAPITRDMVNTHLENSWLSTAQATIGGHVLPEFVMEASWMSSSKVCNPIEAAQAIQYFQDSAEMTQAGQLRQQQMDLYNSLLAAEEAIELEPPPTDRENLGSLAKEDDQSDAMTTESLSNIPHDNMDEEQVHHSDGGHEL